MNRDRAHRGIRLPLRWLAGALLLLGAPAMPSARALAAEAGPVTATGADAPQTVAPPATGEDSPGSSAPILEPDLAEIPLSDAARVRLERARGSVVQIRSFLGNAVSSALHGSGFAVRDDGLIVTNYHVVTEAVLHPGHYRLEYVTADNRSGRLQVLAVDVQNDLALVRASDLALPPLRLRTQIPEQGERAYSIGFPLNLGLTITEGVANGIVANSLEQRIHYTGAINSGMSGGPALDARGAAYGVNVSVIAGRQLVGFVVPAKHIEPLIAAARGPFDETLSARQARELVTSQVLAHQAGLFAATEPGPGTQTVLGYTLPTTLAPTIECGITEGAESGKSLRIENIACSGRTRLRVQSGLEIGDIRFQHRVVHTSSLHPLQFAQLLNRIAATWQRRGSGRDVAEYACRVALVSLDGFDARISTCTRQYRLFAGLYDFDLTVTSVGSSRHAVVSHLELRGTGFELGQQLIRRFLESMRWTP